MASTIFIILRLKPFNVNEPELFIVGGPSTDGKEQKSVDAIATIHVKKPKMCKERLRNASILIMIHKIHNLKSVELRSMGATNVS